MATVEPIIVHILGDSVGLDASLASAGVSIKAFGAAAVTPFATIGAAITSAGASIKAFGATMTAAGVGMSLMVTAPIVAVGAAALLAANNVQKAYAIIIAGTGATGSKLAGLETQFDNLASTVPNSFTDTATVLTTVNNKLSEGAYAISEISKNILDVSRMTGESASSLASEFTAAIQSWGVSAKATEGFMNQVYTAAQAARVPVTSILTDLTTYKPVIESAGFSLQQIIPIIGDIESKGLDVTRTMQGIAYAWANLGKGMAAAKPAAWVDDVTKSMKDAGIQGNTTADQLQGVFYGIQHGLISVGDAANIFGSRFADNVFNVIKDGNLTAAQFIALSNGMSISLNTVGASTITFAQSIDIMKNALEIALNPLGEKLISAFTQLMPLIKDVIGIIGDLASAFSDLPTPVADAIFVVVGLVAAIGPALVIIGGLISAFGSIVTAVGAVVTALPLIVGVMALLAPVIIVATVAIGALVAIIAPMAAAFYLAYTSSAQFRDTLSELEGTLGTVAGAFTTLGSHISSGLSYILSGNYKAGFADFTSGFTDMWNTISKINWEGLGETISTQIVAGVSKLPADLKTIWDTVATDFTTWYNSVDWVGDGKKISAAIVTGITTLTTDLKKIWTTASADFTTWVNGVNWTADAKKIPIAIIAGLNDLQKDLTPIWNTIETSFTTWENSVPWGALATQIPNDISNSIKLSMATIGPVWDYIQISLMNWIQGINWTGVGTALGSGLRYAIQLALNSLVGGLSDLIPTALITTGQPNLVGVGITAAKNFVSGFQSGLGDLWQLIMDGIQPLAGKLADYMEHDVDWTGIGTAIGEILGSMIATVAGDQAGIYSGGSSGGPGTSTGNIIGQQITSPNLGTASFGQSGTSKLAQAGQDAGDALVNGFQKGITDAMSHIDWGTFILDAMGLGQFATGNKTQNSSSNTSSQSFDPNNPLKNPFGSLGDSALSSLGNIKWPTSSILGSISAFDPETWNLGGALGSLGGMANFGGNLTNPMAGGIFGNGSLLPQNLPGASAIMGGLGSIGNFFGGLKAPAMPNLSPQGALDSLGNLGGGYSINNLFGLKKPRLYNTTEGAQSSAQSVPGMINLPSKIMGAAGSVDWGALTKGGIFDLNNGPLAPLAKADYGAEFSKLTKGGIFDLDQGPLAPLMKTNWGAVPGQVTSAVGSAATTVVGGAKSIWDFITGAPKEIWTWITGTAKEVWTWITGTAHDIWSYITGGAHDIWSYITGGAHDIWSYITGGAHDIWSYITGGAHSVWTYITGGAHDIWSYITGGAHDIWSYITGGAHDIWSTYITGGAKTLWGDLITGGSIDVHSLITGSITIGPVTIPVATGGVFAPKVHGVAAVIAEAGEAEMVVPKHRWGEDWGSLINTLPHFGSGAIVGSGGSSGSFSSTLVDTLIKALSGLTSGAPTYQVSIVSDNENIKREVFAAIRELEQYHHLAGQ